jgi:hypothetical protein
MVDEVFVLWHVHELGEGDEDVKLIGVYRSREDAEAAIKRVGSQPGFADTPQGFDMCLYRLNQDHWTEGYTTVYPRTAR